MRWRRALAALLFFGGAAFWAANRLSEAVRSALRSGDVLKVDIDAVLLGDPTHLSMAKWDLCFAAAAAAFVCLVVLAQVAGNTNRKRVGEEHGSARWGRPGEARRFASGDDSTQLRISRVLSVALDGFHTQRNANVLVLGGSGSGKSRHYVLPNASTLGCSMAFTDAKKELYRAAAGPLRERGFRVRILDLIDLGSSMKFNPLAYLDPTAPEVSVMQVVETLTANSDGKRPSGGGNADFFDRAERALMSALIGYVVGSSPEPTLVEVLDLQSQMQAGEGDNADHVSEVDALFAAVREFTQEWHDGGAHQDVDAQDIRVLEWAASQYRIFEQGPGETKMSIIISLGVRFAPFNVGAVREVLSDDEMSFDLLGDEPTAIFLALPDTHTTFAPLSALFWTTMMRYAVYDADHRPDGRLPQFLHMMLDEFANIGRIPGFDQLIATIRGRGIGASIMVQNISQIEAKYGRESARTIVGNCDSTLFLGSPDYEACEWMSKKLGNETIANPEWSQSYGGRGGASRADRKMQRALMTPEELLRLPDSECVALIRGQHPWRSAKLAPARWPARQAHPGDSTRTELVMSGGR